MSLATASVHALRLLSSTPQDPSIDPLLQQIDRLERFGNAVNAMVRHLVTFGLHDIVLLVKVGALAGVVGTAVWLAAKLLVPRLQMKFRRAELAAVRIVPPAEAPLEPMRWLAFFRALYGITAPWWKRWLVGQPWVVFEFESSPGRVVVRCWFPRDLELLVQTCLRAAMPGVELPAETQPVQLPQLPAARARLRLWKEPLYPLGEPRTDALAAAVGALSETHDGLLQLAVAPDVGWEKRAGRRLDELSGVGSHENLLLRLIRLPLDVLFELWWHQPETRTARPAPVRTRQPLPPAEKAYQACWLAEVRACIWASKPDGAVGHLRSVTAAFQALDGENRLRPRRVWWRRGFDAALAQRLGPRAGGLVLSPEELTRLFHLPLVGVAMDEARVRVLPRRPSAASGSFLCRLEDGRRTPVRIAQADRRQHLYMTGPTGSGKSTLLLNLVLQDIEAGIGVGVLDPKGDLIHELLERIPSRHAHRLVLLDPATRERPVGINVLECAEPHQRELVTDAVVTIFQKSFERFWGPRTDDILRAALLTLLRHPSATLCEVPLLLLDRQVRARLTKDLGDPVGLKPFWQEYEAYTDGQRLQIVGPVLNKLRSFLLRPTVRNVLGQSRSTIDLGQVMDSNGILLVNLSKGTLGEETSRLLGAFVVSRIWQAALRRSDRSEAERPDFNLYLDEFQNYLHLPQSLDDVLAEARAYRLNLTLAHQHLDQLRDSTRQALDANARTRVVFQCGQEDARHLAREFSPLSEHNLQSLGRFQVAVRLCVDGHTEVPFTGVTEEPPTSLGLDHANALVETSVQRFGRPRAEVEAEIERRFRDFGGRGGFQEIA
jgi:Type IV secretion-system coupling protein DNA-binding domain